MEKQRFAGILRIRLQKGKRILLIDFDPQCNLSIAMLGEEAFNGVLQTSDAPYRTIRSYLQDFLQNTGGGELFLHKGRHTHENVDLIAGDFWLNVYADSLNVGADLLSGTGLARYVALRRIIKQAEIDSGSPFDFAIIDLPPSFGALVRAAFYSSDYFIVPCTSDNFSVYCVGLIGQMVPSFIRDWQIGLTRFKNANPDFEDFNLLGQPKFAGWVFNGFDTARRRRTPEQIARGAELGQRLMNRADATMHGHLEQAIENDLVNRLRTILDYNAIAIEAAQPYQIGDIEDANVLIQNSLWLNVPLGELNHHQQVVNLQDRSQWAENQLGQITLLRCKFDEAAQNLIRICI